MKESISFLILLCHLLSNVSGQGLEFFVSINDGSDSWDGTSETNIAGSDVGPWKTLSHAIEEIRKIRPNPPTASDHVTISMLPGKLFLSSRIDMDARDSFMTIRALYDEETAISGGQVLNGEWTEEERGIKTQTFQGSCGEAFVGTFRLFPARKPNIADINYNMNIALPPYNTIKDLLVETSSCTRDSTAYSQNCPYEDRLGFVFENEFDSRWAHLDQTKVLVFHSWINEYATVGNISEENGISKIYFKEPLDHAPVGQYVKSGGWRYIIYNNKAILDIPGEYVCIDNGDGSSTLSYIHPDEPGIEELPVVVAQLTQLMQLNGVTDVKMEGLKFERASSGGADGYNWGSEAALRVVSSQNVIVTDCLFSSTGMIGMFITKSNSVQVTRSVFTDIGGHGFMAQYNSESEPGSMFDVTVDNNMFDGCGMNNFWQPACIWMGGDRNMTIRNNEFTNVPYTAINLKGGHGASYWEDNGVTEPTREDYVFQIEYNYIHDYGLGILNDFGAIYMAASSPVSCDNCTPEEYDQYCYVYSHVYNNLIHDGIAYNNGANYLYSDVSSAQNTFENNIMYGSGGMALYHHCGKANRGVNNIIHKTSVLESMYGGCGKSDDARPQEYENTRNIYLLENLDDFVFGQSYHRYYNLPPDFHHNIYWSMVPGDEELQKFPDNQNWYEWRATGNDSESLWQDPLFEDPAAHRYILTENSPAWNLGIQQIDLDNFGIQVEGKYLKRN